MSVNNNVAGEESDLKVKQLFEKCVILNRELLNCGVNIEDLEEVCLKRKTRDTGERQPSLCSGFIIVPTIVTVLCIIILWKIPLFEYITKRTVGTRCWLSNNYFIWEATRPETNCSSCENVTGVLVFENITSDEFEQYAYSSRPMLMKRAAAHWPAMHFFNYTFLKTMYENIEGAYESVEEECQVLTFKTDFKSLEDVFAMSESRVALQKGEKPWYVGWSNCHPEVLSVMRKYYDIPHFLPSDAEHSRMDYIFIGYEQGAVMHIDYISRFMWQAQIKGHKTWKLVPPPDCEHICSRLHFHVEPGDIVLLDTRQWYHDTHIDAGELSLTVSSEYG